MSGRVNRRRGWDSSRKALSVPQMSEVELYPAYRPTRPPLPGTSPWKGPLTCIGGPFRSFAWVAEYGESPSMRELAAAAGISVSTVSYQLKRMWEQGGVVETRSRPSRRCPHCGQ
ncbi:winged helix-turn-helix transcriptional regulator [Streptomyces platensis]|uniref:winged helix-turn-helix transcriptional regulator n=1 Tax=Streptomyces platensis TaxID=58346 RepID=UPI00399D5E94